MKRVIKIGIVCIFAFIAVFITKNYASGEDSSYTVTGADYTVTIPTEIEIDSVSKKQTLTFSGELTDTNELTISVSSKNNNNLVYGDDSIAYTMDKTSFYHASTVASKTPIIVPFSDSIQLTVTDDPRYAETYTDQLSFSFNSVSVNYLDMNGILDGEEITGGNISGVAVADVYVNGNLVSSGCDDFWQRLAYGTSYEVKNIKTNDGYTYIGEDSYSGTLTDKWHRVDLPFMTNYTMTLNACGGSITDSSGSSSSTYGITINKKNYYEDLPTPTRDGYTFDGWYTAEDGVRGATKITEDNALMEYGYTNLYAHWINNDTGMHSYYFDINSYDMDDLEHYEHISSFGSATVTVDGTVQDVDYQLFDGGTEIMISNVTATKDGYKYLGYYIVHHPVKADEDLIIREADLQTDETITITLDKYTSIYFAFEKDESTSTTTSSSSGTSSNTDTSNDDSTTEASSS